jgi:hypothetical protein
MKFCLEYNLKFDFLMLTAPFAHCDVVPPIPNTPMSKQVRKNFHWCGNDLTCVKSCTGYVITFGWCPVLWASKPQMEIALSMMEVEYISLFSTLCKVIPMRALVTKILNAVGLRHWFDPKVYSTLFEDNNMALIYAMASKMSPHMKHIAIKYHFFCEYVKTGAIMIQHVDTEFQVMDIFMKGLAPEWFQFLCKMLMGW